MSGGDLRPSSPRRLDLRSASDARDTKTRLRRDTKSHGIRSWKSIFREACAKRGGREVLFASSVSLTSPLRSEVPEKTKVATSISRSIPFHPVLIKPYVTGWNADASKSGRILRFSRRSTGREKPPRPCHTTLAGRGVAPNRKPRVRYVILIIIANIRNKAGFRS